MSAVHEIPVSVRKYLSQREGMYEVVPHARDYSAQQTAADTHTPGVRFAKCLAMVIDGVHAMVVLPADHRLDWVSLRKSLGGKEARMVKEEEMKALFPDCEVGAEPPLGKMYGMPVYVSKVLAAQPLITFNGGTHEEAMRMSFMEFERLTDPVVIECSVKVTAA